MKYMYALFAWLSIVSCFGCKKKNNNLPGSQYTYEMAGQKLWRFNIYNNVCPPYRSNDTIYNDSTALTIVNNTTVVFEGITLYLNNWSDTSNTITFTGGQTLDFGTLVFNYSLDTLSYTGMNNLGACEQVYYYIRTSW